MEAHGKSNNIEASSTYPSKKTVHFNSITERYVFTENLTSDEIDQLWWSRQETSEIKITCRCIAKKSRLFRSATEGIITELHQETKGATDTLLDGDELEPCLQVSQSARRFVRNYSTVGSQRGLERWISDELKVLSRSSGKKKARILRLQRVPGISDEVIAQLTQSLSRFDRIIARLLGQADELAKTRALDRRSPMDAEVTKLPPSPRLKACDDLHTSNPKLGNDVVSLIRHLAPPCNLSPGNHAAFGYLPLPEGIMSINLS